MRITMTELAQRASGGNGIPEPYLLWKQWQEIDFGRVTKENATYFTQELRASGVPTAKGLNVGELGYGNGAFAGWVKAAGGYWTGCEAIDTLQQRAIAAGFTVVGVGRHFADAC